MHSRMEALVRGETGRAVVARAALGKGGEIGEGGAAKGKVAARVAARLPGRPLAGARQPSGKGGSGSSKVGRWRSWPCVVALSRCPTARASLATPRHFATRSTTFATHVRQGCRYAVSATRPSAKAATL